MANGHGNGKANPQVIEAQRRRDKAQQALTDFDAKVRGLQQQLQQTEVALQAALQANTDAASAYTDAENKTNRDRLIATGQEVDALQAKTKELSRRLAALQPQRAPLDAAWQEASAELGEIQTEAQLAELRQSLAVHSYHIQQHAAALRERERQYREAERQIQQIEQARREAVWQASKRQANANHLKSNGPTPGFERTVRSFGA